MMEEENILILELSLEFSFSSVGGDTSAEIWTKQSIRGKVIKDIYMLPVVEGVYKPFSFLEFCWFVEGVFSPER